MLPTGVICLWFGSIGSIPSGWILCDGTGGTPNLKNKFIVGAGDTYAVDDVGGNINHNHNFTGDGHYHDIVDGVDFLTGANFDDRTATAFSTGTTDNRNGLPPYHSLAYIMKT